MLGLNRHFAVVMEDGTVRISGSNNKTGEFGDNSELTEDRITSFYKPNIDGVHRVFTGFKATIFLKKDGTVWICGDNINGNLGAATRGYIKVPQKIEFNGEDIKTITMNASQTFILNADGSVYFSGNKGYLGEMIQSSNSFIKIMDGVKSIDCGSGHMVVVKKDGSLWGAGLNNNGQTGISYETNPVNNLTEVEGFTDVKKVSAGPNGTVVLLESGEVYGIGENVYREVSSSTSPSVKEWTKQNIENVKDIAVKNNTVFFRTAESEYFVRGNNTKGAGGVFNDAEKIGVIEKIEELSQNNIDYVSGGNSGTFFITDKKEILYCGSNNYGEAGTGDTGEIDDRFEKVVLDETPERLCNDMRYFIPINTLFKKTGIGVFGIEGQEIKIISQDINYKPSELEFQRYDVSKKSMTKEIYETVKDSDMIIFSRKDISGRKLRVDEKIIPFIHGKKILRWSDTSQNFKNIVINGEKKLGYKTKVEINGKVHSDYHGDFKRVPEEILIEPEELTPGDNTVNVRVEHEDGETVTESETNVKLNEQRNFSLEFNGEGYVQADVGEGFTLEDKTVQVIVKPKDGEWSAVVDEGKYVSLDSGKLWIGKSEECIIDQVIIFEKDKNVAYNKKPLRGNEDGLVALYRFNEFHGKYVFDSSPNCYHGEIIGKLVHIDDRDMTQNCCDAIIENNIPSGVNNIPKKEVYKYKLSIVKPETPVALVKEEQFNQYRINGGEIIEYKIDCGHMEHLSGIEVLEDNKVQYVGKKQSDYQWKTKIKELDRVISVNKGVKYTLVNEDTEFNSDIFEQAVRPYTNQIIIDQEDGTTVTAENKFKLINERPQVESAEVKNNILKATINDPDGDKLRYKILINGKPIESEVFSELMESPAYIEKKLTSDMFNVGVENDVAICLMDEYEVESIHNLRFTGKYTGIMFLDENEEYYSSDIGEVIKYLDFGTIVAGSSSKIKKIIVRNDTGFRIKDLKIQIPEGKIPKGNVIRISKENDMSNSQEVLLFNETLMNEEKIEFYIQIHTDYEESENGVFEILTSADYDE